jgi:putative MATE family efflux protein
MNTAFSMLVLTGVIITAAGELFAAPLLRLFGATDGNLPHALAYLHIYLLGTIFTMLATGLNPYINAQGFASTGMFTVVIGAVTNILLDPLFIFVFGLGVRGAALATILSQMVSALWVLRFLTGTAAIVPLRRSAMAIRWPLVGRITTLGLAGFIVYLTNAAVQIACNATLQRWGGDLYIGVMTLISSVRDVLSMPVIGTSDAAKPILSFNYGAGKYHRVRECIRFMSGFCIAVSLVLWGLVFLFPEFFLKLFSSDAELIRAGVPALHTYFFGFFLMTLQFAGQTTFQALGKARRAIFFSLFRKVVIVVPLTILLPSLGFGVMGVFLAEPVSNLVGGGACFATMYFTLYRKLKE